MVKSAADFCLTEYKDTINQRNMTIRSQNELIASMRETIDSNNAAMAVCYEKKLYIM